MTTQHETSHQSLRVLIIATASEEMSKAPLKKSSRMLTLECVVNFITFQLKFTTAGWLKSHFACFAHFSSSQWNSCYIIAGIIHNLSFIHQGSRAFSTMTKKNFLCRYDFPLAHFILEFSKNVTTIFFPWWFRSVRSLSRLCRSCSAHFFTFFSLLLLIQSSWVRIYIFRIPRRLAKGNTKEKSKWKRFRVNFFEKQKGKLEKE